MNSVYNDNYYIDKNVYKNVMKYYQSCVITSPFIDSFCKENRKEDSETIKFDCSEFILDSVDYNETGISDAVNCLIDFVKCQDNLLFMPVFTVFNDELKNLKVGHYSLGMQDEVLIRYIDINDEYASYIQSKSKTDFSITLFLNVKKAIGIYDEMGFIQGVLQIGQLINYLKTKLPKYYISDELNVSQQVLTHQLNINNTEMLMISNLLFNLS